MATYKMVLMHGNRDSEGTHSFDGPDDLLTHSPVTVMRAAMAAMEEQAHIGHIDYELYSSLNNRDKGIVTALGHLLFHGNDQQPFTALISRA